MFPKFNDQENNNFLVRNQVRSKTGVNSGVNTKTAFYWPKSCTVLFVVMTINDIVLIGRLTIQAFLEPLHLLESLPPPSRILE